jgi:hypothetical protein
MMVMRRLAVMALWVFGWFLGSGIIWDVSKNENYNHCQFIVWLVFSALIALGMIGDMVQS